MKAECGAAVDSMSMRSANSETVTVAELGMIFIVNTYSVLYLRAP